MKKTCVLLMVVALSCCLLLGCENEPINLADQKGMFRPATFGMAKSEDGIYIANKMLYFFDPTLEQAVVLCNDPECTHESLYCNAAIGEGNGDSASLFYWNQFLYMVGVDKNETELCLYQIRPDGSGYEKYISIANVSSNYSIDSQTVSFHGGALYFIITEHFKTGKEYHLYRLEIEKGAEPEEITVLEGDLSEIISINSGDDGLWLQQQRYYEQGNTTSKLYYLEDGQTEFQIILDNMTDSRPMGPTPSGHGFYYMSNQKIWQYIDGEETVIVEREQSGIQKGVLLYQDWILDSTGTAIDIYDKEGTLINTVDHTKVGETSQETMTDCYLAGVDEHGLYLAFITMDYMHFLYYAEMGDVVSEEEVEWKLILENF